MKMRLLAPLVILVTIQAGSSALADIDVSHVDQDGRNTARQNVDGSFAELAGNDFHTNSGQCVIYSTLSTDFTSSRQMESGVVRCTNATIDGTCLTGYAFVERWAGGSNYFCTPGYSFTNNTHYDATTYRNSSTSTTFTGHINGVSLTQSGFGLNDTIVALSWGEASGGSSCPSPVQGTFYEWQRYDTSVGWSDVSDSNRYRGYQNLVGSPCWPTISTADSLGGFNVSS